MRTHPEHGGTGDTQLGESPPSLARALYNKFASSERQGQEKGDEAQAKMELQLQLHSSLSGFPDQDPHFPFWFYVSVPYLRWKGGPVIKEVAPTFWTYPFPGHRLAMGTPTMTTPTLR